MKKKVSALKQYEPLLHQLRRGEVGMAEVASALHTILHRRAKYFVARWSRQTLNTPEDLVQEMLLVVWRSVDRWDPSNARALPLCQYVDMQVGIYAQKALKRACGYPDPRRSEPATQTYVEDYSNSNRLASQNHGQGTVEMLLFKYGHAVGLTSPEEQLVRREYEARRGTWAKDRLEGYAKYVVTLVVDEGYTIEEAADAIYANIKLRIRYRLDSQECARRAAYTATAKARAKLEALAHESELL